MNLRLSTSIQRAGFVIFAAGVAASVIGLVMITEAYGCCGSLDRHLKIAFTNGSWGRGWDRMWFYYGTRVAMFGAFLWFLYDLTLARVFRWIRNGAASHS